MKSLVLGFLASLALPALAADDCERRCEIPRSGATLVLDGNTGDRRDGTTRVRALQDVKVVVITPNPFRFAYRTAFTVEAVGPALVREFLGMLGVAEPGAKAAAIPGPSRGQAIGGCKAAELVRAMQAEEAVVAGAERQAGDHLAAARAFFDATAVESVESSCVQICRDATSLVATDPDFAKLRAELAAARKQTDELVAAAAQSDADPCKAALATARPAQETKLGAAEARAAGDDALMARVKAVLAGRSLLATTYSPVTPDEPYRVRIGLFRTDLRRKDAAEEQVGSAEINVGRRILSLSAGVMASWISDQKVARQAANVPDGAGGTTLGSVFGYEDTSTFRPSVLIALNGAILEWSWRGVPLALAGTAGLVASNTTTLEYLLGGSIGFADQTFFLTLGTHFAQIEELAGNFTIGQPVPDGLADPLPVSHRWTSGFAIGVTYRLR